MIQELQLKQKKINYLAYVKDLLENDKHAIDYAEVQVEVLAKLTPEIDRIAKDIEDGTETSNRIQASGPVLTPDQISVLGTLADKVKSKVSQPVTLGPSPIETPSKEKAIMSPNDKMVFAMANRHLAAKTVTVIRPDGTHMKGKVVGLDAPDIIVKTELGPTVTAPLEKILLS